MNRAIWMARARAPRRLPAAALTIALVAATLVPVVALAPAAQAVVSTGGSARFPAVQWIQWGAAEQQLVADASGEITTTETIPVGDDVIEVTCTISDVAGDTLKAYASGPWQGDGLDDLYNIGGTGSANTLVAGIGHVNDGREVTFDFDCGAELVVDTVRSPVELAGLVLAGAESSINSGTRWEHIGATISSDGTWRVIDRIRSAACTEDNYARLTSPTASTSRLELYGAKSTTCESSASTSPNPTTVAFMDGVSSATDVTLYGRGKEALALGVILDLDFGDAPASYGTAPSLSQAAFTGGEPSPYTSGDGQGVFTMTLADQLEPMLRLGATVDFEGTAHSSAAADGDDAAGSDDEDGVTLAANYAATPGGTLTVQDVACYATATGPGLVSGWIDFDGDGAFQASEQSTAVACPTGGGTVDLDFSVPTDLPTNATQATFARFRIAPTAGELTAIGYSSAGEVEDYAVTLAWPETPAMTLTKTHTGGAVVAGQTLTYDLTVENTGNVTLTDVEITDPTATVSGCTWASLPAGESRTCTASRLVTAADVSSGSVVNTASVAADGPGDVPLTPVTSSVTVHVAATAVDDTDSTPINTTLTRSVSAGVLVNDLGEALQVTGYFLPLDPGFLLFDTDGSYIFTPSTNWSGVYSAIYEVRDAASNTDSATLAITVAPTADADAGSTPVDTSVTWTEADLLNGDLGTGLEVTSATDGAHGTTSVAGDGSVTYTPTAGYSGPDSFTYTVTDDSGLTATATVSVDVTPVAVDDADATVVGVAITRAAAAGVRVNDAGTGLEVVDVEVIPAGKGTLSIAADGSYTFTPTAGFSGIVEADYTVEDDSGQQSIATLTITVGIGAVDDADATTAGTALSRAAAAGVLDNDAGTGLEVLSHDVILAGEGTLSIARDGSYAFTPAAGFSGTVTADYTVEDDDGLQAIATLTITVTPVAGPNSGTTSAETAVSWTEAALTADDEGTGLEVVAATDGSHGATSVATEGEVTYTPAAGFSGTDSFTYTVEDDEGQRTSATVTVTVTPVAVDDAAATDAETPVTTDVLADDRGAGLEVVAVGSASDGTVVIDAAGTVTYTPDAGFSGTDSFTYTVEDDEGQQHTATVTVVVAPTASDDADATTSGTDLTRTAGEGVLSNDRGTDLEVVGHDTIPGSQGSLAIAADGSYVYSPAPGFSGTVTADYTVEDGEGQQATASLTIVVGPSAGDDAGTTPVGTPRVFEASELLDDDQGVGLAVVATTQGAHGATTIAADGSVTYTPEAGFSGLDTFTYMVEDAAGGTAQATVTVVVTPRASNNVDVTAGGTTIERDAENGLIPDDTGSGLRVTDYTAPPPEVGTIVINPDGSFRFVPAPGFHGEVEIPYTVTDEHGSTASAVLTLTVDADPPLMAANVEAICVGDVPYLTWETALPEGFAEQGANPLSVTFVNPDGADHTVTGLPLAGRMLWPGASADAPLQWPGWEQRADGTYVETDGNFAWTRDGVDVLLQVNPEVTVTVAYPPASSACANPSAELLASTGAPSWAPLAAGAAALLGAGGLLLLVARRRREG